MSLSTPTLTEDKTWKNKLYICDNLKVLTGLNSESVDLVYLEIAIHVGDCSDTAVFPIDICTEKRLLVAIDNLEDGAANLGFAYCGYCNESN